MENNLVYSTDIASAKKLLVKNTCTRCKTNPLMKDCVCNPEMTDINDPACVIVHQAMEKVFPSA